MNVEVLFSRKKSSSIGDFLSFSFQYFHGKTKSFSFSGQFSKREISTYSKIPDIPKLSDFLPKNYQKLHKLTHISLIGKMPLYATSTDAVLLITKELRKQLSTHDEEDTFVEFFGPAIDEFSIADRSAIANLCNEYNAKTGFFPVDQTTLDYLHQTGREKHSLDVMKKYLECVDLLRNNQNTENNIKYDEVIEVYLPDIVVTISGKFIM